MSERLKHGVEGVAEVSIGAAVAVEAVKRIASVGIHPIPITAAIFATCVVLISDGMERIRSMFHQQKTALA